MAIISSHKSCLTSPCACGTLRARFGGAASESRQIVGRIVILKDFTFVGSLGVLFSTSWIAFPAEHQSAQLALVVKSVVAGSNLSVQLQGTFDTSKVVPVSPPSVLGSPGITLVDIATGLTPLVNLQLIASATSRLVLSAYLTPKAT